MPKEGLIQWHSASEGQSKDSNPDTGVQSPAHFTVLGGARKVFLEKNLPNPPFPPQGKQVQKTKEAQLNLLYQCS